MSTWLVLLSLCSISQGALVQTRFQKLTNGNRTSETVIRTEHLKSQFLCTQSCLADEECRGYHWGQQKDSLEQHKCELLKHVHLPKIQSGVAGVNLYVDADVPCYNTSQCLGPFFPICQENECKLLCDPHQESTEDGNCTLAATFSNIKNSLTSIPWYNVAGEEPLDYIQINDECSPSDECGILISLDQPPSRMFDFWPLKYNFWPNSMLYVRYNGEGKYSASTFISNYGEQTKEEYKHKDVKGFKPPPHQLRITVGAWNGNKRKVSVDLKLSSDKSSTIAATELESSLTDSAKLDYYLAFVHNTNWIRTLTGPLHLKGVVRYINPVGTCPSDENYVTVVYRPNYGDRTCVQKRSTWFMGSAGSPRANFWDQRKKQYYDFEVQTKTTASRLQVVLGMGAETFNSIPSSPKAILTLQQTGSSTLMTFEFFRISYTYSPKEETTLCTEGSDLELRTFHVDWSIVIDGSDVFPQAPKGTHTVKEECLLITSKTSEYWVKQTVAVAALYVISFEGDAANFTIG
eukprot:TCALIF_02601-PA protein Name:"Protein of unknown function" AED:0.31 eAED:0.21 QI:0/0.5/0/0.6/0.25/0/5/0/518